MVARVPRISPGPVHNTRTVQCRVILHGMGIGKYCCRNIYVPAVQVLVRLDREPVHLRNIEVSVNQGVINTSLLYNGNF